MSDEPDSQPGLRAPRAGSVTPEQRAFSSEILDVAYVGQRFQSISEKLDAATLDRGFARLYLDLCEECDDLRAALVALKAKLRERAKADIAKMEVRDGQVRRGPPRE